jgi:hypothetical protein
MYEHVDEEEGHAVSSGPKYRIQGVIFGATDTKMFHTYRDDVEMLDDALCEATQVFSCLQLEDSRWGISSMIAGQGNFIPLEQLGLTHSRFGLNYFAWNQQLAGEAYYEPLPNNTISVYALFVPLYFNTICILGMLDLKRIHIC